MLALTPSALSRISTILVQEKAGQGFVRLEVKGGGCAGFQYAFSLADDLAPDDVVLGTPEARLVLDPVSSDMLKDATLDYAEGLMEAGFKIINPQAVSGCGCGMSFAL